MPAFDCALREIDPAADYEVIERPGYQPLPPVTIKGEQLQRYRAVIDSQPGSLILEYHRAAAR